ncbi:MAG: alanine racemase [Verrucomicrobiales bacterium]
MSVPHSTAQAAFRTWIEIDLAGLRHNAAVARQCAGEGNRVMAVVKANGYGLGAVACARALADHVDAFGVATLDEAIELRSAGLERPIYILSPLLPSEIAPAVRYGFMAAISTWHEGEAFSAAAHQTGKPALIHFVLDTGMGRIGVLEDEAQVLATKVGQQPGLIIDSVASHFPSADEDEPFTLEQQKRFWLLADGMRQAGLNFRFTQIANSCGALGYPRTAPEMLRCGLMLFGLSPMKAYQPRLQQVLTWKTRVILVRGMPRGRGISYGRTFVTSRKTTVATLAVGYADGYQRHLSGRGAEVLIRGQRCPVLGRVTMDQIMVDVTDLPPAVAGDEAILIGKDGPEEITAGELAEKAGTIPYEILTGLGRRVARLVKT